MKDNHVYMRVGSKNNATISGRDFGIFQLVVLWPSISGIGWL